MNKNNINNNNNEVFEIDFVNKIEERFIRFEEKFRELIDFIDKEGGEIKKDIRKLKHLRNKKKLIKLV